MKDSWNTTRNQLRMTNKYNVHSPYCQYCFDQPFDTEEEYFENEYCNERCKERYEEEREKE